MKTILALATVLIFAASADARWRRNQCSTCTQAAPQCLSPVAPQATGGEDALSEVNAARARRGLAPFIRDVALETAARGAAAFRASRLLFGHVTGGMGDFAFVPAGTSAAAAGCAAYPASYGWMSCCTFESHRYAGAAWAMGSDGKRYMHLFVR